MKINIILFLVSLSSFCQSYDKIIISQMNINGINFNQTTLSFQNNFGNPNNISSYHNELSNEDWQQHQYFNNYFYFENDTLIEFLLKDDHYYLQNNNIKVGNNIDILNLYYPSSFINKEVINNIGFIRINIVLEDNSPTDMFIIINYNKDTNVITTIHSSTS